MEGNLLRKLLMLTVILLALTGGFGTKRAEATSKSVRIAQAEHQIAIARHSLRWITLHKANYRNSRVYHQVIVKFRKMLFAAQKVVAKLTTPSQPPHYSAWLCIHRFEGSWTDSGAPYYGGLQMDWAFMNTYGHSLLISKGTADHWTPMEQMWVAEKAYSSGRGFYPWPNTARMCGLI